MTQNDREAACFYRPAADQGDEFAQVNLGFLYELVEAAFRRMTSKLPTSIVAPPIRASPLDNQPKPTRQSSTLPGNKLATFCEEGRGGFPKIAAKRDPHAPMGAHGIGQIGITGVGTAVANAVYNARGKRIREPPTFCE